MRHSGELSFFNSPKNYFSSNSCWRLFYDHELRSLHSRKSIQVRVKRKGSVWFTDSSTNQLGDLSQLIFPPKASVFKSVKWEDWVGSLEHLSTLFPFYDALGTVASTRSFLKCERSWRRISILSNNSHKARGERRDWTGCALPMEDACCFVWNQNLTLSPQFSLISICFQALPRCKQLS